MLKINGAKYLSGNIYGASIMTILPYHLLIALVLLPEQSTFIKMK